MQPFIPVKTKNLKAIVERGFLAGDKRCMDVALLVSFLWSFFKSIFKNWKCCHKLVFFIITFRLL